MLLDMPLAQNFLENHLEPSMTTAYSTQPLHKAISKSRRACQPFGRSTIFNMNVGWTHKV